MLSGQERPRSSINLKIFLSVTHFKDTYKPYYEIVDQAYLENIYPVKTNIETIDFNIPEIAKAELRYVQRYEMVFNPYLWIFETITERACWF